MSLSSQFHNRQLIKGEICVFTSFLSCNLVVISDLMMPSNEPGKSHDFRVKLVNNTLYTTNPEVVIGSIYMAVATLLNSLLKSFAKRTFVSYNF